MPQPDLRAGGQGQQVLGAADGESQKNGRELKVPARAWDIFGAVVALLVCIEIVAMLWWWIRKVEKRKKGGDDEN